MCAELADPGSSRRIKRRSRNQQRSDAAPSAVPRECPANLGGSGSGAPLDGSSSSVRVIASTRRGAVQRGPGEQGTRTHTHTAHGTFPAPAAAQTPNSHAALVRDGVRVAGRIALGFFRRSARPWHGGGFEIEHVDDAVPPCSSVRSRWPHAADAPARGRAPRRAWLCTGPLRADLLRRPAPPPHLRH